MGIKLLISSALFAQSFLNNFVHVSAALTTHELEVQNRQESSPSPIFIILTEGGCSETSAIELYTTEIVKAHGIKHMNSVSHEFLRGNVKASRGYFKNPYYTKMVIDRNMTRTVAKHANFTNMIIESIQLAQHNAKKFNGVMFFKASVPQFKKLKERFDQELDGISYIGLYRENALDRCACLVKDCFHNAKAKDYGDSVFASNGTKSDMCFQRRKHPEVKIQAKFHNVEKCLKDDQALIDFTKDKPFDSVSSESLMAFEYSMSMDVFETAIDHWMKYLKPFLRGTLNREVVTSVLEKFQGTRKMKSQANAIYDYEKLRDRLMDSEQWGVYLRDEVISD